MSKKKLSNELLMIIGMFPILLLALLLGYIFDNMATFIAIWFPFGFLFGRFLQKKYGDLPEEVKWTDLTPNQKKIRIVVIAVISLTLVGGIVTYILYS